MKVYIVMQVEYDYECSRAMPILVTPNLVRAEAKVEEMNAFKKVVIDAANKVEDHMRNWMIDNPRIYPSPIDPIPMPKLPRSKKLWTQEQRNQHNEITVLNRDAEIAASRAVCEWIDRHHEEHTSFVETFPDEIQKNILSLTFRTVFEIEEAPYEG